MAEQHAQHRDVSVRRFSRQPLSRTPYFLTLRQNRIDKAIYISFIQITCLVGAGVGSRHVPISSKAVVISNTNIKSAAAAGHLNALVLLSVSLGPIWRV